MVKAKVFLFVIFTLLACCGGAAVGINEVDIKTNKKDKILPVSTLSLNELKAKKIITLTNQACALSVLNKVFCWRLSTKDLNPVLKEVSFGSNQQVKDIFGHGVSQGGYLDAGVHACALLKGGGVRCWWDSEYIEDYVFDASRILNLKSKSQAHSSSVSLSLPSYSLAGDAKKKLDSATKLLLEHNVICGILPDSSLYCPHSVYSLFNGQQNIVDAYFGEILSCVLTKAGTVKCFDMRASENISSIISLKFTGSELITTFKANVIHDFGLCIIDSQSRLACWEKPTVTETQYSAVHTIQVETIQPEKLVGVKSVSMSETNTCALLENGNVYCWGQNAYAQIKTTDLDKVIEAPGVKIEMSGNKKVIDFAVAPGYSCFILRDNTVQCRGKVVAESY